MAEAIRGRVHWVDALKVLVVGGIAVFHAFLVFSGRPWLVNNREPDHLMAAFDGFTYQWGLALMFVLTGAATWFSLRGRSALTFLAQRWRKLGIPFLVGVAVLSPLQWYVAAGGGAGLGDVTVGVMRWYRSLSFDWHLSSTAGTTYHLWFLLFLLGISTAALPLLVWLRTDHGRRLVSGLARHSTGRSGFLLFGLPVAAVAMAVQPAFPGYEDWGDFVRYGAVFVAGYVLVSDSRFADGLRRQGRTALWTGIGLIAGAGVLALTGGLAELEGHPGYTPLYVGYVGLRALNMWAWVTVFLNFGVRVLDVDSPAFRRLGEMIMPFYVLHHPVLVLIAAQVVLLDWAPWPKALVIIAGTLSITYVLCLGVEHWRPLRAFFGMHAPPPGPPRRRPAAAVA